MRVLLINPFYPISETPSPPLGLAYLAAALENAGHRVRILDGVVMPLNSQTIEAVLAEFSPKMVGVTAVTMTVDRAMAAVADVKRIDPDIITVAGGPHVTFCTEETLNDHPGLDIVAMGEGEATLVSLAAAIQAGDPWHQVRGIVFRSKEGIHQTEQQPFIRDINSLPTPARHLIPLGRYRALGMPVSMITSRGCPFQCIFCVGRKMVGAKVRYRDPLSVVDEMAALNRLGFHQINIADDLFTASPHHCNAVCDEILRRDLKLMWTSFARVDTVNPKVLSRMKAAGCTGVSFGIETADPGILKTVKKGITLTQVTEAVKMCNAAGVTPFASFVLGLPGETPATLQKTVAFAEGLEKKGVAYGYHLLAPFPGTAVREKSTAYGLKILTDDWSRYHANRAIVETDGVTAAMLDDIVIRWKERYDAFLGDIERRMKEGRISDEEAFPLVNLERIVLLYDLMMERVLETLEDAKPGGGEIPDEDRCDPLIETVHRKTGKPLDKTRDALTWAVDKGHIRPVENNGCIRWKWRSFI